MNFIEAFKMLEIEPTKDKKKIKMAYSKLLKKYHPEEFPEMFMRINEAYGVALEYVENEFMENDNLSTQSYSNYKEYSENEKIGDTEFSDIFEGENIAEKSKEAIYQWIRKLKTIIVSEKRPLKDYKNILNEFHYNLDETEKKEILNILLGKRFLDKDSLITEFERQLLLYNLNSTENVFEETFEVNKYEFPEHSLEQIAKNLKSNNVEDVEKGYEKFIREYLNIKIFRLFGKKIALYSDKNLKNFKNSNLGGVDSYNIKKEFAQINDYIHIFDIEDKYKNGIGEKVSSFVMRIFWYIFFPLIPIFFEISEILPLIIMVFASLIGLALDWINIVNEKDFKWSRKHGISSSLFVVIIAVSPMIILAIDRISMMSALQYILIIIGCLLISTILFVKMVSTSRLRYKRLKKFSEKVLDVFMFNK